MICPLCKSSKNTLFYSDYTHSKAGRSFYKCFDCALIFVDHLEHLTFAEEKKRYALHENSPEDSRYIAFLDLLIQPLRVYIKHQSKGLDFGCGPGPAVRYMLKDLTANVDEYDPYFKADLDLLKRKYDFLVATEVIEHFRCPHDNFKQINNLLLKGGMIGFMTSMFTGEVDFESWGYKNDPTHIAFYAPETFMRIADMYNWKLLEQTERMVIYRKN